jgi:hypothetical protein
MGTPGDATSGPYGPNTTLVERFLAHVANAPARHWIAAVTRWIEVDRDDAGAALAALGDAVDALRVAEDDAHRLARQVRQHASSVDWRAGTYSATALRRIGPKATPVTLAAAWALAARHLLDPHVFGQLYGPWAESVPLNALEREA